VSPAVVPARYPRYSFGWGLVLLLLSVGAGEIGGTLRIRVGVLKGLWGFPHAV